VATAYNTVALIVSSLRAVRTYRGLYTFSLYAAAGVVTKPCQGRGGGGGGVHNLTRRR